MKTHSPTLLPYQLRRSLRVKYLRINVKPHLIEVVAPVKATDKQILSFVTSQQEWIKSAQQRVTEKQQNIPDLAPAHYADGVEIPYQGQQLPLQIKYYAGKTIRVQLVSAALFVISLPTEIESTRSSELIRHALINWMKKQMRHQAMLLIEKYGQALNLIPRSLKIKTLKSRWGSCGPQNDINLNWLLLLAPPAALEYVVIHELCHIKHKNHSRDFWNLVGKYFPTYQQQRLWLKQHGASLMKGL